METFLFECAQDLWSKKNGDLHDVCIVLPSKRSGLFFVQCLQKIIDKPVILPQIITVNDLFSTKASGQTTDSILLVSKLFDVYKKSINTDELFEDFVYWGQMLLNDFDDIDKYLVDPNAIFSNIESIKDIEKRFSYLTDEQILLIKRFWGTFIADKLSKEQEALYAIWPKLLPIYTEFKELLRSERVAYEGMIYREVIENISDNGAELFTKSSYAFMGFNALNECEKRLFSYLKSQEKALFYWDVDPYYMNEEYNEAGFFIKENIKKYPNELTVKKGSDLVGMAVSIVKAPSSVSQVKYVTQTIEKWIDRGIDLSKCAIILCDEALLLPLLHSIPKAVNSLNITMGFPVRVTHAFNVVNTLLRLQKNSKNGNFLYQDIAEICKDPQASLLIPQELLSKLLKIDGHNYDRIDVPIVSGNASILFGNPSSGIELLEYLESSCVHIAKSLSITNSSSTRDFHIECYYTCSNAFRKIKEIILSDGHLMKISFAEMLVKQVLSTLKVSFIGEPLSGLQVMGILESRVLNFEHLVMVSVNEGVMPSSSTSPSYIPFNLRQGFGLPTVKQRDAIYAYYFYRLLQKTKEATLLHFSQSSSTNNSEPSRYMLQMMYGKDFHIDQHSLSLSMKLSKEIGLKVEKTPEIMSVLISRYSSGGKGLSATAINTFIDCKLKFFYSYIAGLRPEEETLDLPNQVEFGNIYHRAIQHIYKDKVGMLVDDEWIDEVLSNDDLITQSVKKAFSEEYKLKYNAEIVGYDGVILGIIKLYIKRILESDKIIVPLKIIGLEMEVNNVSRRILVNDTCYDVVFYGFIDRVDEVNGVVRIIDYKTGKKENNIGSVDNLFDMESNKRNGKAFQALFYSFLYSELYNTPNVHPSLYFVRENAIYTDSSIYVKTGEIKAFSSVEDQFTGGLDTVIKNLFDKDEPFTQNVKNCNYCDFRKMCNK